MVGMYLWAWVETLRATLWEQVSAHPVAAEDEVGQNGLEYALVAGVVVVAIIGAFTTFPIPSIITSALNKVKALVS